MKPWLYISVLNYVYLHIHAEPPSLPMNLSVIATDNGSVLLEWNPPRDNGGADITNYHIFINSSEVLRSNVTMAIIILDPEEDCFIQVRAINSAGESDNTSAIFTGIYLLSKLVPYRCQSGHSNTSCRES